MGSHNCSGCRVLCSCRKTEGFAFAQKPRVTWSHWAGAEVNSAPESSLLHTCSEPQGAESWMLHGEMWGPLGFGLHHTSELADPRPSPDSLGGAGMSQSPGDATAPGSLDQRGYACVQDTQQHKELSVASTKLLKLKALVTQSCQTLCDPMNCSPPGASDHGIFQARILEWVAISFSRGSSPPKDQT